MNRLRFLLAFPLLLLAWLAMTIGVAIGGPRAARAAVNFLREVADRTAGL